MRTYAIIESCKQPGEPCTTRQVEQYSDHLQAFMDAFERNRLARSVCPEFSYSVKRS